MFSPVSIWHIAPIHTERESMQMQGVRRHTEWYVRVCVFRLLKFWMDYYFIKCINVLIKRNFFSLFERTQQSKTKQKAKVCHISRMVVDVERAHTLIHIASFNERNRKECRFVWWDYFCSRIYIFIYIFFSFSLIYFLKMVNEWALNVFQTLSPAFSLSYCYRIFFMPIDKSVCVNHSICF